MVEDQVQDEVEDQGRPPRRKPAAKLPPLRPPDWAFVRLGVLQGLTLRTLARQMQRDVTSFQKAARAAGVDAPEAPGDRVRCMALWQGDLALMAMQAGDLAQAEKRLRLVAAFARTMALAGQGADDEAMRMAMAMMGERDVRRVPVDQLSEAELRAELARILGIEVKGGAGCGDGGGAEPGAGADAGGAPVPGAGARRADPAAG